MTARSQFRPIAPTLVLVAALVVPAFLAGCSLSRPAPVKQTFLIESAAPPVAARTQPGTLRVRTFNVGSAFRGKAFVYRETDLKYESDFYSEFLVAPAAMLGEGTARALENAKVFARVVAPGAPPDGNFVLDAFVDALYGDARSGSTPVAEIGVTYYLSRADAVTPVPFWSKQYRKNAPVATKTPEAYAAALSVAFGEITAELARDLTALQLPSPSASAPSN
jgi:cholesterol transport system auxiliary component